MTKELYAVGSWTMNAKCQRVRHLQPNRLAIHHISMLTNPFQ